MTIAMRVTVAAIQMSCGWDRDENLDKAERLIRAAYGPLLTLDGRTPVLTPASKG